MTATMPQPPRPAGITADDERPVRCALDGVTAWINRPGLRHAGLPVETPGLSTLLTPLIAGDYVPAITFKSDLRSCVQQIELNGFPFVWKRFLSPQRWRQNNLLGCGLQLSPAWRNWHGATRLAAVGIRTAVPLILIQGACLSALLLPSIDGKTLHQYLKEDAPALATDQSTRRLLFMLARTVGQQIGQMTARGLVNADHKPSNLIVDDLCRRGDEPPVIIDQTDIRRRFGDARVLRMLATLLRTAGRAVRVDPRLAMTCLRAVRAADPSWAPRIPTVRLARKIVAAAERQARR